MLKHTHTHTNTTERERKRMQKTDARITHPNVHVCPLGGNGGPACTNMDRSSGVRISRSPYKRWWWNVSAQENTHVVQTLLIPGFKDLGLVCRD